MQSQQILPFQHQPFNPDDYQFKKKLGEGKFAVVYLACSKKNNTEQIAIKKGNQDKYGDISNEEEILAEIQNRLNAKPKLKEDSNPFLTQYYGSYKTKTTPYECIYFAFEFMNAGNLEKWALSKEFNFKDLYAFTNQIAQGLKYLKEIKVVHKDIKPANILLHNNGNGIFAKIGDFGLAETIKIDMKFFGSPGYWSPELIEETLNPSSASDVYAFGITLFEVSHRKDFVPLLNDDEFNEHIITGKREVIDAKKVPPKISKLIQWCWLSDRSKRPTPEQICNVTKTDIKEESDELKQSEKLYNYDKALQQFIY